MSEVVLLDGGATRRCLPPQTLLDTVAEALVAISHGTVSAPPRLAARAPAGLVGAMPGYVPGFGLGAKVISVFAQPGAPGRSAHRGVVALFDEDDGRLLALVDAESLTALRTAATATVAMRALARPDAGPVAVLGAGSQARAQVELLGSTVAEHAGAGAPELIVAARDPARAEQLAALVPGAAVATIEEAVRKAAVVLCCTGASEPVLRRDWLQPGTHVSSVGGSPGGEIGADILETATLFVEWLGAVTEEPPAGAYELQGLDPASAHLVGDVLAGHHPGRRSPAETTVFKSTGHAALDVAAASLAYRSAIETGAGRSVSWS